MSTDNQTRQPNWNPEIQPFLAAVADGELLLGYCRDCEEYHFYPRSMCPFCHGMNTKWLPSNGRGTVYSYSIQRRVAQPFVIGYVTLEEGPTMMTRIVDIKLLESVYVGQPVELVFRDDVDGIRAPMFRPLANS